MSKYIIKSVSIILFMLCCHDNAYADDTVTHSERCQMVQETLTYRGSFERTIARSEKAFQRWREKEHSDKRAMNMHKHARRLVSAFKDAGRLPEANQYVWYLIRQDDDFNSCFGLSMLQDIYDHPEAAVSVRLEAVVSLYQAASQRGDHAAQKSYATDMFTDYQRYGVRGLEVSTRYAVEHEELNFLLDIVAAASAISADIGGLDIDTLYPAIHMLYKSGHEELAQKQWVAALDGRSVQYSSDESEAYRWPLQDTFPIGHPIFTYPSRAMEQGLEGNCAVSFSVDTRGRPYDVNAECSDTIFRREAVRAVSRMKFLPAVTENGRPGERENVIYPVEFGLSK